MSRVTYDSKRLIPAPFVTIEKRYQRSGDGTRVGKVYNITVAGTLVAFKGSPDSNGDFHAAGGYPDDETVVSNSRLSSLQRKQEALRELFATEGLSFEIQALDATSPVKCNPRILSIDFPQGLWYDRCEYTIVLECDELYGGTNAEEDTYPQYISSVTETWSVETDEGSPEGIDRPRTYMLRHGLSAVGKRFYNDVNELSKQGWEAARDYVVPRLGFNESIALSSGVNNLPSYYGGYNHIRTENIDKSAGSYEVNETWLLASGSALEEFSIQVADAIEEPYSKVSINGNITGLEVRNSGDLSLTTSKYDNATTKFTEVSNLLIARAQTYSGLTLNISPLREMIGRDPVRGTINYSYEYDDRPVHISGAKDSMVSVEDMLTGQSYASIFILGRSAGPVLQDLGTTQELRRSLSIDVTVEPTNFGGKTETEIRNALNNNPRLTGSTSTDIQNIITAASPTSAGYGTVFQHQPKEQWEPLSGKYSYAVEWTYQ
jgi:hypothetical protein